MVWVHQFDAVYQAIGEYKVPTLTDRLIDAVVDYLTLRKKDFVVVRPAREKHSVHAIGVDCELAGYNFIPVRLTADYRTLTQRVTRRSYESPCRITTKEALDEYLNARPEQPYPGEHVIATDSLTPEQVAGRIKELLP
jgi:hypothetical protein